MSSQNTLLRYAVIVLILASAILCPTSSRATTTAPRTPQASSDQVDGMVQSVADSFLDKTDYYWHRGDYPRIIALSRVLVEADPYDTQAYSNAGWLMESDKQNSDAEAFYELGCERNPGQSFMAYQLGFFYFNTLHNYRKAIGVMSKSVHDADATDADWKLLAYSYKRSGDLKQALATFQEIKKLYPNSPNVDHNMKEIVAMIQQKQTAAKSTQ